MQPFFAFFVVQGIALFKNPRQFGVERCAGGDGVLGDGSELDAGQSGLALLVAHVGQQNFANCGAVQRHAPANTRIHADLELGFDLQYIDGGIAIEYAHVHCFAKLFGEFFGDRARRGVQIEMVECARAHVEHLQGDGPAIVFCPTGIAEFLQGLQEAIYGWLGQLDFTGKLFKSDGALPGKFFQDTKNPHCRTDKRGSGGF